jgi:hypothetical protein
MATGKCPDDPATLERGTVCVSALSKDLEGGFTLRDSSNRSCRAPQCSTLMTIHDVTATASAYPPCDSRLAKIVGGPIRLRKLVTIFDLDATHRGFHAAEFIWTGATGVKINGRISGVTNVGTLRKPVFEKDCQRCDEPDVMEGRLCGQIEAPKRPDLHGCQVLASYRIWLPLSRNAKSGPVRGTIEGVIVCPCKK